MSHKVILSIEGITSNYQLATYRRREVQESGSSCDSWPITRKTWDCVKEDPLVDA